MLVFFVIKLSCDIAKIKNSFSHLFLCSSESSKARLADEVN